VRAVRAARGCTVNDVVLCVLAGGLRRYLDSLGIDPERQPVVAAVPASIRTPSQSRAMGNRLGVHFVPLALGPGEETERLEVTAAITRRLKEGRGHDAVAALLAAADLLPPPLMAWISRHARIPSLAGVIATNVRGPESTRFLAGRRVEALHPIVPIADGLGLGLAVLSYAGAMHVCIDADADLVPDVEKLRAGIEEATARLVGVL
jgi:WS/DGAT/MGAT family acyltransferase